MKKLIVSIIICLASLIVYAGERVEFNVDIGVFDKDDKGKLYLKKSTTDIQFKTGLVYGVVIKSKTPTKFKCSSEITVPSLDKVEVNGKKCAGCDSGVDQLTLESHEFNRGVNVIKSEMKLCENYFGFMEELTKKDIPGKRVIKYKVGDDSMKTVIINVHP